MNILEKNLLTLPKLKKYYENNKTSIYPIEESKKGPLTLKINNIYIHSKYDPMKEAERIADVLLIDREILDIIILFGSGLGYVAKYLFDKIILNSTQKTLPYIIYIEKDLNLFFTSLTYFDWSSLFCHNNFKFFLDAEKEVIGSFIQSIPTKRIRYYYHRPTYIINEEYYKNLQNYISYVLDRKDMNTATFCNFQQLWTKNYIYNLPKVLYTKPIKSLNNIGKNTTSIIVAAGPTLEQSIEYLKKIKDKAVIIAVDTVYKYLIKHSINPDIIVSIDPQYWNYKYLEDVKIEESLIVTNSNVYPKILDIAGIENFFTGSSIFPIVKFFEENNKERGILSAGGSVSTTAFDVARIIGSTQIVLIGLDLSFPNRMTHFKGAFFESNFLKHCNYYKTAEHSSYNYLAHVELKTTESTNGTVFTDQKMFLFKKWFDREIPLTNARVFQPDLGGAILEGAKILPLSNLPIPDENTMDLFLKNKTEIVKYKNKVDKKNIFNKINLIINKSKEIKEICKKIIRLIPKNGNIKHSNENTVIKLEKSIFDNNERKIVADVISSSAQDILLSIMENIEYNDDEKISAWIKTRLLYKSIMELSDFYEKCLKKLLKVSENGTENYNVQ